MSTTFGVEIEFIIGNDYYLQELVASKLSEATGLSVLAAGYTHQNRSLWKVVSDRSISGTGHELVSPVLTEERMGEIDQMCHALAQLGAKVNRSCGLHIHVGLRQPTRGDLSEIAKRLALFYAHYEDVIDQLLPPSRRNNNNRFIRSLKTNMDKSGLMDARDVTSVGSYAIRRALTESRYAKLNFASYYKYGTVEFRHHSGTIDPEKIKNWARFCMKMVEMAYNAPPPPPQPVPPARPVPSATRGVMPSYWANGRRRRILFQLLTRSEGCTTAEAQSALNLSTPPSIRVHLERSGVRFTQMGTRSGHTVFAITDAGYSVATDEYLAPVTPPSLEPTEPPTLDNLLERLALTPNERMYWHERAELLSSNG